MALLASFIGIDRYHDPRVRDLNGARRDAVALWALFRDTLPDIQAELLIDRDATKSGIRAQFDRTLAAATSEDTVILSFAGHGTRDHRLVAHDTEMPRLSDTTIPMAELADRFKSSRAKAVLCILDCCFSGGAPARVLDDAPSTRDPGFPLEAVAGVGRYLLAASNINEVALEHPKNRHGLLTGALIETLQASDHGGSLTSAVDVVMQRVRAEADRMGSIQTPVLFGHIEGGLFLPILRPGAEFYKAFPERKGARIGGRIEELSAFGLPGSLLDEWSALFPGGLNELQVAAVNDHRILDGNSLLVVAPTSSGKTFIGEMAAAKAVSDDRRAVFLFPYKALVNEKFDQFKRVYSDRLGMRVVRCTGDYQDQTSSFLQGKYDLAVLTYEMFLNLSLGNAAVLNQIALVVLDEAQFITDPSRGINVELLLTNLLTARKRGVEPQLIALSAVIGALNHFDEWLCCAKLVTERRPVPLEEGVIDREGTYQYLDGEGNPATKQLIPWGSVIRRRDKPGAQDVIVPLIRQLLHHNPAENIIVFRNQRGKAQGCAAYLASDLGLPPAIEAIAALPSHDPSKTSDQLRKCLAGGTAFHTANLNRDEREVVERAYRAKDGKVKVLGATTTVAAGINTPASTVIIAEQEFKGEDGRPFTVAEYKNMAGRAGRLGYNEVGRSIIYAEHGSQRESLFRRYVLGKPEPIRSSFQVEHLETWVMRLLAQVRSKGRRELIHLLANTYGGYLATRNDPQWHDDMEDRLERVLEHMIDLELVEQEDGIVRLSLLGQACGRSSLSFDSAVRLIRILKERQYQPLTAEELMVLVQALPELDAIYTPIMKKGGSESRWSGQAAHIFSPSVVRTLQSRADDVAVYYARCKRAAVLGAWIRGQPIEAIETESTVNFFYKIEPGHVRGFADTTRFHLRPAYQIVTLLLMTNGPGEEQIDSLLKQLEVGIPSDALGLLSLPISLTRGEYLALFGAGIRTASDFWAVQSEVVARLIGEDRGAQLNAMRP